MKYNPSLQAHFWIGIYCGVSWVAGFWIRAKLRYITLMKRLILHIVLLPVVLICTNACTSISYYSQSVLGQYEILAKSQDIEQLLTEKIDPVSKKKLALLLEILDFARQDLLLPDNGSYRRYTDLKRPYVIWNVFATEELSLQPKQWCYLVVGCLSYRGYFSRDEAKALADELNAQGLDVFMGGVTAYSTLGWFKDPVLNTMISRDDIYLARVVFHELAHQKLYVKDDSEFNEAYADAIATIGLQRWLDKQDLQSKYQQLLLEKEYEDQFVNLVLNYKTKLQSLYESSANDSFKRSEKKLLFTRLEVEYQQLKQGWNNYNGLDNWFDTQTNNARISAISTYRELVPGFIIRYHLANENLETFYKDITALSKCTLEQRHKILLKKTNDWSCLVKL